MKNLRMHRNLCIYTKFFVHSVPNALYYIPVRFSIKVLIGIRGEANG